MGGDGVLTDCTGERGLADSEGLWTLSGEGEFTDSAAIRDLGEVGLTEATGSEAGVTVSGGLVDRAGEWGLTDSVTVGEGALTWNFGEADLTDSEVICGEGGLTDSVAIWDFGKGQFTEATGREDSLTNSKGLQDLRGEEGLATSAV